MSNFSTGATPNGATMGVFIARDFFSRAKKFLGQNFLPGIFLCSRFFPEKISGIITKNLRQKLCPRFFRPKQSQTKISGNKKNLWVPLIFSTEAGNEKDLLNAFKLFIFVKTFLTLSVSPRH
jgi:hypothetical protein